MERFMCKLSIALLFLRTVNTMTHSYDTSAVLPQLFLINTVSKIFASAFCVKFPVQTSGWAEQTHTHTYIYIYVYIMMYQSNTTKFCYNNTIINIIKFCCVWLIHHCVYIYKMQAVVNNFTVSCSSHKKLISGFIL